MKIACLSKHQRGEFNSEELSNFCLQEGIKGKLSTTYSP